MMVMVMVIYDDDNDDGDGDGDGDDDDDDDDDDGGGGGGGGGGHRTSGKLTSPSTWTFYRRENSAAISQLDVEIPFRMNL